MEQRSKDPMLTFKSVKLGKDSKNNDRVQLSMTQETAHVLYETLGAELENPRGVKLDIHLTKPTTQDGRQFDSGYAFIKGIQEFGAGGFAGAGNKAAPTKFTRTPAAKERIANAKKDIAG